MRSAIKTGAASSLLALLAPTAALGQGVSPLYATYSGPNGVHLNLGASAALQLDALGYLLVDVAQSEASLGGGGGSSGGTVAQGTPGSATAGWYVQPATSANFPITAASLPLPAGAATSANQPLATGGVPYAGSLVPTTQPGFLIPSTSIPLSTLGAAGTTVTINTAGMGSLGLYATFSNGAAGTLSFFASTNNGATYVPVAPMTAASQGSGVEPTTISASSNLRFNVAHYTQLQVQLTTAGSGTATIQGDATQSVDTPEIRSTIAKPVFNQPVVNGATVNSANPEPVAQTSQPPPYPVSSTTAAFTTSATAGSFTTALPQNLGRRGGVIAYYGTGTVSVYFGSGTAAAAASIRLGPGYTQSVPLSTIPGVVTTDAVQIASTVASDGVVVITQ